MLKQLERIDLRTMWAEEFIALTLRLAREGNLLPRGEMVGIEPEFKTRGI